jgi:hypothetical protein
LPADVAGRAAVILRMMLLTEVVGEPGAIYVTTISTTRTGRSSGAQQRCF